MEWDSDRLDRVEQVHINGGPQLSSIRRGVKSVARKKADRVAITAKFDGVCSIGRQRKVACDGVKVGEKVWWYRGRSFASRWLKSYTSHEICERMWVFEEFDIGLDEQVYDSDSLVERPRTGACVG
jgi:hypothetical protein